MVFFKTLKFVENRDFSLIWVKLGILTGKGWSYRFEFFKARIYLFLMNFRLLAHKEEEINVKKANFG